jgi:hypothetical protein
MRVRTPFALLFDRLTSGNPDIILAIRMEKPKTVQGKIGDTVRETGNYICDNCGHYQVFEEHDEFTDCTSCWEPDITWELE